MLLPADQESASELHPPLARSHYERPLDNLAQLQLFYDQSRHDSFAGTGIVSDEESDLGVSQDVSINGFNLMRQRVNLRGVHGEQGVVKTGIPVTQAFEGEKYFPWFRTESGAVAQYFYRGKLG